MYEEIDKCVFDLLIRYITHVFLYKRIFCYQSRSFGGRCVYYSGMQLNFITSLRT